MRMYEPETILCKVDVEMPMALAEGLRDRLQYLRGTTAHLDPSLREIEVFHDAEIGLKGLRLVFRSGLRIASRRARKAIEKAALGCGPFGPLDLEPWEGVSDTTSL